MENNNSQVEKQTVPQRLLAYLKALPKRFFITAFSGMAQGLFVTLIAGTILALIAKWVGADNYVGATLNSIANIAKSLMGAGIGVGIAYALGKNKLLVFSAGVAGMIGAFADKLMPSASLPFASLSLGAPGNPIGAYVVTMLVVEVVSLYAGKTKLDILLVPLGSLILSLLGVFVAFPFIWLVNQLGELIALATNTAPFIMGIIIAVVMGVLLTMPTSSAAIWIAVASPVLSNPASPPEAINAMYLAGGAAVVGCSCHMIGFAFASFKDNGFGGLISQGIGTSMLQIPNIMKKPVIMLPEIIASAICGPLSTCVFKLYCNASGGGMGTSGLVGVFGTIEASSGVVNPVIMWVGIILLMFILPAVICSLLSLVMHKIGWIKPGDQKLD